MKVSNNIVYWHTVQFLGYNVSTMKNKLPFGLIILFVLFLFACDRGEEVQKVISITNITPGTTMVGGNTLNTAMIGDTITIIGQNFSAIANENLVSVQGIPAIIIAALPTEIKAKVPPGVPFSYVDVEVARTGYQKAVSPISVRAYSSPAITGISPTSGPVGTIVTIYGKNLEETLASNMIAFTDAKGELANIVIRPFSPIVATADSIQIKVPLGAGTGKISLYARPAQNIDNAFVGIVTPVFTVN